MSDQKFLGVSILAASALISGSVLFLATRPSAPLPGTTGEERAEIGAGPYVLGNADAKVTIIEFGDYQCPFCKKFAEDIEPQIIEQYVKTGKARFSYRTFPIVETFTNPPGKESTDAAMATACAGDQEKFWEYHRLLFSRQSGENEGAFRRENLKLWAKELGLNEAAFAECLDSEKHLSAVRQDALDGGNAGVTGTPATFMNGILVKGIRPLASIQKIIEDELNR